MFALGLFILVVVFGSILLGVAALFFGLAAKNWPVIRFTCFALFVLSFLPLVLWITHDPNDSDEAKSWYGQYAIRACDSGSSINDTWNGPVLNLYAKQICSVQDSINDTTLIVGRWDFVQTEDMSFLELKFPQRGTIQVYGNADGFRTNGRLPTGECN